MANRILLNSRFKQKKPHRIQDKIPRLGSSDLGIKVSSFTIKFPTKIENILTETSQPFRPLKTLIQVKRPDKRPVLPVIVQPNIGFSREISTSAAKRSIHSERLKWKKRKLQADLPVLVINFTGVLGDFYRPNLWLDQYPNLYMRKGWLPGLRRLMESFFLVLFCSIPSDQMAILLNVFKANRIVFDAVYTKIGESPAFVQDYSQVASDFATDNIFLISSVGLNHSDLEHRECLNAISDKTMSVGRKIIALGLPANLQIPVILVSNPRAQERTMSVTFDNIADSILDINKNNKRTRKTVIPLFTHQGNIQNEFCTCHLLMERKGVLGPYQLIHKGHSSLR